MVNGLHHNAPAQLFHHHHALDGPHAHAAMVFTDIQAAKAQLGLLGVGRAVKPARLCNGPAAFKGIALVHPFAHSIAQLFLLV